MQKYTFPTPPPVPALPLVEEAAESTAFRAHIEEVAARGGGVVTVPKETENRLTTSALSVFWAAVDAELTGTPWKTEPSGLRDGGAARQLVPVQPPRRTLGGSS